MGMDLPGTGPGLRSINLVQVGSIDRDAHFGFNFYTPDPEALHAALASRGTETTSIRSGNGMRFFEFRDNCGNWIGVCHYPDAA